LNIHIKTNYNMVESNQKHLEQHLNERFKS
jgi:hypothetical protein